MEPVALQAPSEGSNNSALERKPASPLPRDFQGRIREPGGSGRLPGQQWKKRQSGAGEASCGSFHGLSFPIGMKDVRRG
jgi:hypothetical protein